jgi:hypothetical protein
LNLQVPQNVGKLCGWVTTSLRRTLLCGVTHTLTHIQWKLGSTNSLTRPQKKKALNKNNKFNLIILPPFCKNDFLC